MPEPLWCRATRALHFSGTSTIEQAIQWIVDHENDPDLELPLLVPKARTGWLAWL